MNNLQKMNKLRGFLLKIVSEVAYGDQNFVNDILNRNKKNRQVIIAREKILIRARNEIWEFSNKSSELFWQVTSSPVRPNKYWRSISFTCIANILGGDHSSWVKMSSKLGL